MLSRVGDVRTDEVIPRLTFDIAYLCTKFDDSIVSRSRDTKEDPKIVNMGDLVWGYRQCHCSIECRPMRCHFLFAFNTNRVSSTILGYDCKSVNSYDTN